jgi:type VI secretion system protein ImpA
MLLNKKRETEPDAEPESDSEEAQDEIQEAPAEESSPAPAAAARAVSRKALSVEPADRDDALRRIVASALFLRTADPNDPIPYLLLRSVRWGELRAQGDTVSQEMLDPPSSEIRQQLKRAAMDGDWTLVRETAETAMGMPCGRGWLDLQRYAVRACVELGSSSAATAIAAELKSLLTQFPTLPEMTLLDDTPTANSETQGWLKELFPANPVPEPEPEPEPEITPVETEQPADETAIPDAYQQAQDALRSSEPDEAISILTREIARERSGRGRFLRRLQLAQICLRCGRDLIAGAILEELEREIELRKLEDWEMPETIAQALVLLFHCLEKGDANEAQKRKIYAQICRLDPVQAARLNR